MADLVINGALVDGSPVDVTCQDGVVVGIDPAGLGGDATETLDAAGCVLLTAAAEPHAHLDKVLTADRVHNPTGDLAGAIGAWRAGYGERDHADLVGRAERVLHRMVVSGITAARTHVDCGPDIELRAVEAMLEVRDRWAAAIDLQICALVAPPTIGADRAGAFARLDSALALGVDLVGGVPYAEADPQAATEGLLERAAAAGVGVDFHTDETLDPSVLSLVDLAEAAADFPHSVTASHCCSLAVQDPGRQAEVAAMVADAGVGVVALPQTNLFLQARDEPVRPARGLTAIAALQSAGAAVCAGADNVQDPFNTMGRVDPCEIASLLVTAGHVDAGDAWPMVADAARSVLGLASAGPQVGAIADLLVLRGPSVRGAVADGSAARTVIRAGRVIARTETVTRTAAEIPMGSDI
ncbi:MAG: amidohydrolase family protein [Actinomycetota bacterium]